MIGKDLLAKSCRENDDLADNGTPLEKSLPTLGFDSDDVSYVAIQRSLRMYAVLKGRGVKSLTMTDLRQASPEDRMLITAFAAAWTDGLACASRALDAEGR